LSELFRGENLERFIGQERVLKKKGLLSKKKKDYAVDWGEQKRRGLVMERKKRKGCIRKREIYAFSEGEDWPVGEFTESHHEGKFNI